ncbi:MAG: 3-hydroxyacyl-ACP dehydratase FabZ [Planctomycetes bacterium]|nr:3-hydroxyacyl-ACP dehydratase FabZ [Planctomycetota bacterium]
MNEGPVSDSGSLDIQGVLKIAPHRYPFLMVDRVLERSDTKAVGIKNVTYNEPCFTGHFPERPIFPGVLMLEALAQMGGLLVLGRDENMGKLALFTGADEVKWRRTVVPGDQVKLSVELLKEKRGLCVVKGEASVDGDLACAATVKFMVTDERAK